MNMVIEATTNHKEASCEEMSHEKLISNGGAVGTVKEEGFTNRRAEGDGEAPVGSPKLAEGNSPKSEGISGPTLDPNCFLFLYLFIYLNSLVIARMSMPNTR